MRKKTFSFVFDKIFWFLVYALPALLLVLGCIHQDVNNTFTFIDTVLLDGIDSNFIYTGLVDLFGSSGVLPVFGSNDLIPRILTYFIAVSLIHLAVDFLLFIPRFAHKYLNKMVGDEDGK